MTIPRLHVALELRAEALLPLDRAQRHYLATVLRLGAGDPVLVFNGRNGEWAAALQGGGPAALRVGRRTRAPGDEPGPALLVAPIRAKRLEWLVEKAVELGVARILPVLTERTVARPESLARLRARVVEAAEQCGRLSLPELADPAPLLTTVDQVAADGIVAFADEAGDAPPILELLEAEPVVAILVGPEGGFTPAERQALRGRAGVRPVSLGPRRLRAETAAVHALACWSARADQCAARGVTARGSRARRHGSTGGDTR